MVLMHVLAEVQPAGWHPCFCLHTPSCTVAGCRLALEHSSIERKIVRSGKQRLALCVCASSAD
eukprot:5256429-Amphidinium_carterae.1